VLVLSSLVLTWLLVELVLNAIEEPSELSSGRVLGQELPPRKIIPSIDIPGPEERLRHLSEWREPLIVNGRKITNGDLYGIAREDPLIGHVPLENAISANGWWQTNDLGARARSPIARSPPEGTRRLLLFGDSYTHGSRVPQEDTVASFMDASLTYVEVVNFGVDGYSMGQCFLRYETLKERIDHHEVFLIVVPEADLWREINTIRYIARTWSAYKVNPRFIIENDSLRLIESPYADLDEMVRENRPSVSPELRSHLARYDRFYFKSRYEPNPLLDHSVTFRLLKRWWAKRQQNTLFSGLMDTSSEALQVTRMIALSMAGSVRGEGAHFTLVVMPGPGDTERYLQDSAYRARWNTMSDFLCADLPTCYDLMEEFSEAPLSTFDSGYDGSHFGPSGNRAIASFLIGRAYPRSPDARSLGKLPGGAYESDQVTNVQGPATDF